MSEKEDKVELKEEQLKETTGGADIIITGGPKYPSNEYGTLSKNDQFWNGSFTFVYPGDSGSFPLSQSVHCNQYIYNSYMGYMCIGSMNFEVGELKNEMEYKGKFNG